MNQMNIADYLTVDIKSKINTWKKYVGIDNDITNLKWILKNTQKISEHIETSSSNNSKIRNYVVLTKICKLLGDEKQYEKFSKISALCARKITKNTTREPKKLQQVSWQDILLLRSQYKEKSENYPKDYKLHLKYLILCLLTYQPPLSSLYDDLQIIHKKPKIDSFNYWWIKSKYDHRIVLNKDRVLKDTTDVVIEVESKILMKIMNDSVERFERKYMVSLIKDKNKPIKNICFIRILKEIQPNLSVDIFKSAYITQFMNNKSMDELNEDEKHNADDKRHLAKQMRMTYNSLHNRHCTIKKKYAKQKQESDSDESDND